MRTLTLLCLCTASLFGGRAYVQADNTAQTIVIPSRYANLTRHSETMRFRTGTTCQTPSGNSIYLGFGFALGCGNSSFTTITFWAGMNGVAPQVLATAADGVQQNTWYFISMQRTEKTMDVVMHRMDGTVLVRKTIAPPGWTRNTGTQQFFRGGGPGTGNTGFAFAHMCWYEELLADSAEAIPVPRDGVCETEYKLQGWGFEGDLYSDDRLMNLRGSSGSSVFEVVPAYDPIIQFTLNGAQAGGTATLDARASFYFSPPNSATPPAFRTDEFTIQQISGPSELVISDRRSAVATIRNWVAGTYVFSVHAAGYGSKTRTVTVMARDMENLLIVPNNEARVPAFVSFRLDDVQNAVQVQAEVMRPDGGVYVPVLCTTSPCKVWVDSRQNDHMVRFTYVNAAGRELAKSEWQRLSNKASAVDTPALPSVSYGRQASMSKYGADSWASNRALAAKMAWRTVDRIFGDSVNDRDLLPFSSRDGSIFTVYTDMAYIADSDMDRIRATPELVPYYERALAHTYVNYDLQTTGGSRSNAIWSGRDMFDYEEATDITPSSAAGANGVLLAGSQDCPAGCTDRTAAAYNTTVADVALSASQPNVLIGYSEYFDEINWDVSTGAAGCTVTYEYWDGSAWSALTLRTDTTESSRQRLARSGRVRFTPPANWERGVKSGTRQKMWVRVGVGSCTTYPVLSRIYGDDWRVPEIAAVDRRMFEFSIFAVADGRKFASLAMNVSFAQPNANATWVYSRSDGSWAPLTLTADTTNGLRKAGIGTIAWSVPADWAAVDHSGSGVAKFWIGIRNSGSITPSVVSTFTADGGSAAPVVSTGSGRGWAPSHPGVIRVGTHKAYNPEPPSTALARFEYQARAQVTFWSANRYGPNHGLTLPDGHHAASYAFASIFSAKLAVNNQVHNALFFDDAVRDTGPSPLASPSTISVAAGTGDHTMGAGMNKTMYADFVAVAGEKFPGMKVGFNGPVDMDHCKMGDYCKEEGYRTYSAVNSGNLVNMWPQMDAMATDNPRGAVLSFHCNDNNFFPSVGGGRFYWDLSHRGPMFCQAQYLQAANPFTRSGYFPDTVFSYGSTIDVWLKDTPVVLSADVTPSSTQMCSTAFASFPISTATTYKYSIGGEGMQWSRKLSAGDCLTFSDPTFNDTVVRTYPAGSLAWSVTSCLWGVTCVPKLSDGNVVKWSWVHGANSTDVGTPLGSRAIYGTTTSNNTKNNVYVRQYTKAVALTVLGNGTDHATSDFLTRGNTIRFDAAGWCSGAGCRLYPLQPDGFTANWMCPDAERTQDGGCTGYAPYRSGDGQIFMREPVQ